MNFVKINEHNDKGEVVRTVAVDDKTWKHLVDAKATGNMYYVEHIPEPQSGDVLSQHKTRGFELKSMSHIAKPPVRQEPLAFNGEVQSNPVEEKKEEIKVEEPPVKKNLSLAEIEASYTMPELKAFLADKNITYKTNTSKQGLAQLYFDNQ